VQAGEFRRAYEDLQKADYDVVGVSGDPQEKIDRFRESLDLPFALVSDAEGKILRSYRVRWPLVGLARRTTFVIDRDKTVLFAFGSETSMTAHAEQACEFVGERAR
jgi:peroxiredoxin Q/BCP